MGGEYKGKDKREFGRLLCISIWAAPLAYPSAPAQGTRGAALSAKAGTPAGGLA
jgi:hypothetical protein